jgi:hypothetical protein
VTNGTSGSPNIQKRERFALAKEGGMPQTDLIKRFTETSLETTFWLPDTSIRVQTNCQAVADQLGRAPAPSTTNAPDFVLRIVGESDEDVEPGPASGIHHLSHDGLSFINLGQKSFLACDRQARQGICFIPRTLVTDEVRFSQHFLPALISLLKESLETLS